MPDNFEIRARFYDPSVWRLMQIDPVGDGLNLYGYVGGDSVNFTDPTGLLRRRACLDDGTCSDWIN